MAVKNTGTERLIKDTAKKVFLTDVRLHATTEDIAREAGVPRTSVHYYFRSKDVLYHQVFTEALQELTKRLNAVIDSKQPFRAKLEEFIDVGLSQTTEHPFLVTFVVTEMINHGHELIDKNSPELLSKFRREIAAEMKKGTIRKMEPMQFILNLYSLLFYPAISGPILKPLFQIDGKAYRKLLEGRKGIILKSLLI